MIVPFDKNLLPPLLRKNGNDEISVNTAKLIENPNKNGNNPSNLQSIIDISLTVYFVAKYHICPRIEEIAIFKRKSYNETIFFNLVLE